MGPQLAKEPTRMTFTLYAALVRLATGSNTESKVEVLSKAHTIEISRCSASSLKWSQTWAPVRRGEAPGRVDGCGVGAIYSYQFCVTDV